MEITFSSFKISNLAAFARWILLLDCSCVHIYSLKSTVQCRLKNQKRLMVMDIFTDIYNILQMFLCFRSFTGWTTASFPHPQSSLSAFISPSACLERSKIRRRGNSRKHWPIFPFAAVLSRLGGVCSFMDIDSSSALWSQPSTFRLESRGCLWGHWQLQTSSADITLWYVCCSGLVGQ